MVEVDGTAVEVGHRWDAVIPSAPGATGDETILIRGIAPGMATVRLDQRRSWEGTGESLDSLVVRIVILPAGTDGPNSA